MSSSDDGSESPEGDWRTRGATAVDRLLKASATERILLSFAALLAALAVGTVIVLVSGIVTSCSDPALVVPGVGTFCYDPVTVFGTMLRGAFGSVFNLSVTLTQTSLLLFTGLSVAIAFRAGLFNIGTQGQLMVGALTTAVLTLAAVPYLPATVLGTAVLVPFGLLAGAVAGGLFGVIPGALKAYLDTNEVISTIMLNFIATGGAFVLVQEVFQDPNSQSVQTTPLPAHATVPSVLFPSNTNFSLLTLALALAFAGGLYWLLTRTAFGYDVQATGKQPEAAEYGGVDANRITISAFGLSGAIGGIGGAVYVLMVLGRWRVGFPPIGFDGIAVSVLAGNHPFGVVPAALLFGAMKSGSLAIDFQLGVPSQLVQVLRGLIILFVAAPEFFRIVAREFDLGSGETVSEGETS